MTGKELRAKRALAGIPGHAVCSRTNILRSRLPDVENGYVTATPDELSRISTAIDEIIKTRQHIEKLAGEAGLSLAGMQL